MTTHKYSDAMAAAQACGARIVELLGQAIADRGVAALAISGGSSPKPMYQYFARTRFAWEKVHVFWVDERGVPPTHPQSNFKFANDNWFAPAKYPEANIHRIKAELEAEEAARLYADELTRFFRGFPKFDAMHLGMGPDAHTASLFPGEPLILDCTGVAAAVWVEKMHQFRITVLPGVIAAARHRVMLVTGEDKVPALQAVLKGPRDPLKYPAQIVPQEGTEMFLDEAAAKGL